MRKYALWFFRQMSAVRGRLLLRIIAGLLYQTKDHIRLDFGWEIVAKCFFSYRPEVAVPDCIF